MASSYSSLDTTWPHSHLPAPAPAPALWPCHAWFSPAAAAFENDALASALAHASASPSSPTPSCSTTTTSSASELSSLVPYDAPAHDAQPVACRPPGPAARQCTGRVSKRKPRASRRPPTTYITADPADFRRMVQEITGFGVPHSGGEHAAFPAAAPQRRPDPLAFVLPTLDTSACFMLNQAPPPPPQQQRWEDKTSGGAAAATDAGAGDSSLLLMQELEAMMSAPPPASGFPTLESWGMI